MHYTSIYYQWTDETSAKPADATADMRGGRLMGMMDDNLDEKIQKSEVRGPIATMINAKFDSVDANKDGALDEKELAASGVMAMMNRPR
jgi:hypothetical protein